MNQTGQGPSAFRNEASEAKIFSTPFLSEYRSGKNFKNTKRESDR